MFGWLLNIYLKTRKLNFFNLRNNNKYKQFSTATRPSLSFEIQVLAGFRSHLSGVLIEFWYWHKIVLCWIHIRTAGTTIQPITTTLRTDWIMLLSFELKPLNSLDVEKVGCLTPQEPEKFKGLHTSDASDLV
jgi:hypothetical protein